MSDCAVCRVVQVIRLPKQDCCGLRVCQPCTQRLGQEGCAVCTSPDVRARTKLHDYAAAGDSRKVRKHLGRGAPVGKCDERGWTPLHFASKAGQTECVELLVAADADPDAVDDSGWTPLMEAAWGDFANSVLVLLADERVTVNKQDKDGWTALHAAAFKGHENCALRLVEHGGDVHRGDFAAPPQTPGMLAAQCNHSGLAVLLGHSGAPAAAAAAPLEPEPEPEPPAAQPRQLSPRIEQQRQPDPGPGRASLGQPLAALDPFEAATREAWGPPPRPGALVLSTPGQAGPPPGEPPPQHSPTARGFNGPPRPRPPPGEPPPGGESPQPRPPTSAPPQQVRDRLIPLLPSNHSCG